MSNTCTGRYQAYCLPKEFQDAEDYCVSQGSHLASSHSVTDDELIGFVAADTCGGGSHYIGFNRLRDNGWEWTDGSDTKYNHWSREPLDASPEHDVSVISDSSAWIPYTTDWEYEKNSELYFVCNGPFSTVFSSKPGRVIGVKLEVVNYLENRFRDC